MHIFSFGHLQFNHLPDHFRKAGAKVQLFCETTKFFCKKMQNDCIISAIGMNNP